MGSESVFFPKSLLSSLLNSETVHVALEHLTRELPFVATAEIFKKNELGWNKVASAKNYQFQHQSESFASFLDKQNFHRAELVDGRADDFEQQEVLYYHFSRLIPTRDKENIALALAGAITDNKDSLLESVDQLLPILSNLYHVHKSNSEQELLHKKIAEQKETLQLNKSLLEGVGDAIFRHDLQGRILDCNHQAIISLGYSKEELLSKKVKDIDVTVSEGLPLRKMLVEKLQPGNSITIQSKHQRKDGTQFPVEVTVNLHENNSYLAVARDVSQRTEIRKELEETQVFLKNIINLSDSILYAYNLEKDLIVNGAERINKRLGYPSGTVKRLSDFEPFFHDDDREIVYSNFKKALTSEGNESIIFENRCLLANGKWTWVKSSITVGERRQDGKPKILFITSTDINRYKKLEKSLVEEQKKYMSLVDNAFDGIVIVSNEEKVIYASSPAYKMFNYRTDAGFDYALTDYFHPDDRALIEKAWDRVLIKPDEPYIVDNVRIYYHGSDKPYKWTKIILNNKFDLPHINGVVINISDMTAELAAKSEADKKELYYKSLVERSFDGIAMFDASGEIQFVSDSTKKLLGYDSNEVIAGNVADHVFAEDFDKVNEGFQRLLTKPSESFDLPEYRLNKKDGSTIWVQNTLTNLLDDINVGGVISNFRDISNRKETEQTLYNIENFDAVTGLPNRKFLMQKIQQCMLESAETKQQLGLVIIDINALNEINTAHGHFIGDKVITKVADVIKTSVSASMFVSKLGDDEFAILFNKHSTYEISRTCQDILLKFERLFTLEGHKVKISLSAGVSLYPKDATTERDLINCAEVAVKNSKTNLESFSFYKNYDSEQTKYRLDLEKDLIEAIANNELSMVYQPIVCAKTGEIYCFESLLRWKHPDKGVISPALFVKVAEESNLIGDLSQWVLTAVIKQIAQWNKQGLQAHITVNLSPLDIRRKNLNHFIEQSLMEHSVSPKSLMLEITESEELLDLEFAISQMNELNQLGVGIILDDFGTGFSSVSHLLNLPIRAAKIDKTFTQKIANLSKTEALKFMQGIINLIQGSGVKTVVEGVETKEQFHVLSDSGDIYYQGYLFSKPISGDETAKLLEQGSFDLNKFFI